METTHQHTPSTTLKELKRCSKSFEAVQQAAVLALLNRDGVGFKIRKPERRSQKTLQLFLIDALLLPNGDVVDYGKDVEEYCNVFVVRELADSGYAALKPSDIESISSITKVAVNGVSIERLKQIKRHKDANKTSIGFNWLLERCHSLGYDFKKRTTKPTKFTTKMSKICQISGKLIFDLNTITLLGKTVNNAIYTRFDKSAASIEIPPNDPVLSDLLISCSTSKENNEKVTPDKATSITDEPKDEPKDESEVNKEMKRITTELVPLDVNSYITNSSIQHNNDSPTLSTFNPINFDSYYSPDDTGFIQHYFFDDY